jgi:hypothetical protein
MNSHHGAEGDPAEGEVVKMQPMKATGRFPFFNRQMDASRCGNALGVT